MLIHGRLSVTQNCLMLDEVRSLLQKALRRQETDLAYRATKELIGPTKDQLPWKSIVTFMFEDHCLTHVDTLKRLYQLYQSKDKRKCVELLSKCYTCRHAACLQVVAIGDSYRPDGEMWDTNIPLSPDLQGLVAKKAGCIDMDILIALIVKNWQEKNTKALTTLFGLVNMSEKVEKRNLTKAGVNALIGRDIKKPTLHQLVLSVLYKYSADSYMKDLALMCFKFAAMGDVPQGLIMFATLSQLIFKDKILETPIVDGELGKIDWKNIRKLEKMPDWAVDKHTFRGKFGRASEHVFRKQIQKNPFTEEEFREFHGERSKADIRTFFDVGCVCNKDILEVNPIWEEAKQMYLKQKPSMQKTHKMTAMYYNEMRQSKNIIFGNQPIIDFEETPPPPTPIRKRKLKRSCEEASGKRQKLEPTPSSSGIKRKTDNTEKAAGRPDGWARWPLLQLPTGSGKVYTKLDLATNTVWKGPYQSKSRQNLCVFFHSVMKEVFHDKHTLDIEGKGMYIVFPLLKSKDANVNVVHRAFYDCIGKQDVSEDAGKFVERSSLGLVQLHKLPLEQVDDIPLTVWGHFAFRYALNIGDTGLYNAIATDDMTTIFGIDMEERRNQIKGNDVMNMLFGKLPRNMLATEILNILKKNVDAFIAMIGADFDFEKIDDLSKKYCLEYHAERCKNRLVALKDAMVRQASEKL